MNKSFRTAVAQSHVTPNPAPSHTAVHIDIGTLRLHGYNDAQQRRFLHSLETHLLHLAGEPRQWAMFASQHIAELAVVKPRNGSSPESAARQVAQRVFELCAQSDTEDRHG
ncbi:hypothetical protein [Dyella sp. 2HG41-7]|uniref:hypothetical protein n=1 Tax=Dyella sp. 2HG41-7 TaxID=2883239 RepID=UPI001F3180FF|nr:hypothetical protein [Dyella sp. 2HG41-7]